MLAQPFIVPQLPIDLVRKIASDCNYKEIDYNKASCVISFRKESVRINVYYTTGTIGTCLNHPQRGKTQLFRRNVQQNQLKQIFKNPRSHTGKGYHYRKNLKQDWKSDSGDITTDFGSRWVYVCLATGLVKDKQILANLVDCMNKISRLLWEEKTLPTMLGMRFACGSFSAIRELVVEIAALDGALGAVNFREMMDLPFGQLPDVHGYDQECRCDNYKAFYEKHAEQMRELKTKMRELPKIVRVEICDWLVGVLMCGYILVDADYDWVAQTAGVEDAHRDYGNTFYSKKDVAKGMCAKHGILGDP